MTVFLSKNKFCVSSFFRNAQEALPTDLYRPASVPYRKTLLLVGGECFSACQPHSASDEILEYEPDSESWITREEKMTTGRYTFGAALVEDIIVNCV